MPRVLRTPRLLWSVTSTVVETNQRVVGITGANPLRIKPYYTSGLFQISYIGNTNYTLTRCAVLGSMDGVNFPPLGTASEVLWVTQFSLAIGQGFVRGAKVPSIDPVSVELAPSLIPEWLMLEYSGTVGATPTITFEVWGAFAGDPPYGVE